MKQIGLMMVLSAVLGFIPTGVFAAEANEGAQLTATFAVVPPVIDGKISPGEWDDGGVAGGEWCIHNTGEPVDAQYIPVVKVKYGIKGIYVLWDHPDPTPTTGGNYEWKGAVNGFTFVNYCTIYIDPTGGQTTQSFGLQAEPSVSANGSTAVDPLGNSYGYNGVGLYEGLKTRWTSTAEAMADQGVPADQVVFWAGGTVWDFKKSRVLDGLKADGKGYVMEWFIAYEDMAQGFWNGYMKTVDTNLADYNLAEDAGLKNDDGTGPGTMGVSEAGFAKSYVSGMPAPGTVWEMNFGTDWGDDSGPRYYNWVGGTSGFASKPFGKVIFGEATPSAVRDAMLHLD